MRAPNRRVRNVEPVRYPPLWAAEGSCQELSDEAAMERYEERAAILEFEAGLPRMEAERRARATMLAPQGHPRTPRSS